MKEEVGKRRSESEEAPEPVEPELAIATWLLNTRSHVPRLCASNASVVLLLCFSHLIYPTSVDPQMRHASDQLQDRPVLRTYVLLLPETNECRY